MNSKEFEWDLKIVPPSKVQELQERMSKEAVDQKTFFEEILRPINDKITLYEEEGKSKCYQGYKLSRFKISQQNKKDNNSLTISYDGRTKYCSVEFVALAEQYFEDVISHEHRRTIKLYKDYDANKEKFLHFKDKIYEVDGKITLRRPYVDIVLPAPDSLQMVTYPDLACNQRNYSVLEGMLDALVNTAAKVY